MNSLKIPFAIIIVVILALGYKKFYFTESVMRECDTLFKAEVMYDSITYEKHPFLSAYCRYKLLWTPSLTKIGNTNDLNDADLMRFLITCG